MQENKKKFEELGLGKYASNSSQLRVDKSQEKNKSGEQADEEQNGSGTDTSDSAEVIFIHLCVHIVISY